MRILLADDHDMVRETISAYLQSEGGATVTSAVDLPGALGEIADNGPYDLVLLDYNMPGMNGLAGLGTALEANGGKGVAILSGSAPARTAKEALDAGAIGFIPKTMGAQSLLNAVRFMSAGEIYVPVELMRKEAEAPSPPAGRQVEPKGNRGAGWPVPWSLQQGDRPGTGAAGSHHQAACAHAMPQAGCKKTAPRRR